MEGDTATLEPALPPIDWDSALDCARLFGGGGPSITLAQARKAVADVDERAHRAVAMVGEYSGLEYSSVPPIRIVDRGAWSRTNVQGLKVLLDRVGVETDETTGVTARVTGYQAGALLAFLSSRVLGQYVPFASAEGPDEGGALLFVAPNIVAMEQRLNLTPGDFRTWIALHEATHLLQFRAVPWMGEHFLGLVRDIVGGTDTGSFVREAYQRLNDSEEGDELGLLGALTGSDRREPLERVQALMSLLEGHAESLMDTIGAAEVPSVETLRRRFDRHRAKPGAVTRTVRRLLGMEAKYSQYVAGKKFVDTIVRAEGLRGFNRIWESPEMLPTLAEIRDPDSWRERTRA